MKQVSGLSGVMLFFCFHAFAQQGWTDLLDQKLSRWGIYQSYRHTVKYDGTLPKDEKGDTIPAIGLDKNVADVFTVIRENGDLVLCDGFAKLPLRYSGGQDYPAYKREDTIAERGYGIIL